MSELGASLPGRFLRELVDEFTDVNTIGFMLAGSHARGDAAEFSDVDLMKFVTVLPEMESERYVVRFRSDRLVCVKVATIVEKLAELERPEKAIWAVPGIRQAMVLSDPGGELEELKRRAETFDWKSFERSPDAYSSNELAGLSEEIHKLLNAASSGDESAEYAILGLLLGVTRVVAVRLGVMIESENEYFAAVRDAVGPGSKWSEHHRQICEGGTPQSRVQSALRLYPLTAEIAGTARNEDDAAVIAETVRRIEDFLSESK